MDDLKVEETHKRIVTCNIRGAELHKMLRDRVAMQVGMAVQNDPVIGPQLHANVKCEVTWRVDPSVPNDVIFTVALVEDKLKSPYKTHAQGEEE